MVEKATKPVRGQITKTLSDLLANVHSEMDGLRDELQDWLDSMPVNLQDGQKAEELEEAMEAIEGVDEIECPTGLEQTEVTWVESTRRRKSRNDRRDDCLAALAAAIAMLDDRKDAEYEGLKDEIQSAHDEYEAVSFPGMH